ncbi:MAG: HK97 gp10 family phage protein [Candidatus Caldarchaeum sp.]|nr:HK97 gp10 family phage protein [Candidatus Caldarchaeum sp.]MCS7138364.1 HK97 gp10 family phage protein [Candidatus Caldarchaeum sp.]MDW7977336.1 HK97 gp10 family phage protein [Candidatus Caldarchaeum sp.]MDW8359667.1 HK97 gp10 family phage protein [Candidatus Caldarchaeum sp.]
MIKVKGIEATAAGLLKLREEARAKVDEYLGRLADSIAGRARQNAPVRTGRLRQSIEARKTAPLQHVVEASAPYAGYVEHGTSKTPPRRFMQNAVAQTLENPP